MEEDFERDVKIILIGDGRVGKTSMIKRFCKGVYTDEYKKTIGVDFLEKAMFVDALGEEVRFMLWDTGLSGPWKLIRLMHACGVVACAP
jgi:Ras-related protein Rab-23